MTETSPLFPDEPMTPANPTSQSSAKASPPKAAARVLMPNRNQLEWRASDLESLLPPGHRARIVWGYVERQDLEGLYAGIKVVEGGVGRAAIAPEILYALWLYATLDGVGSARALARLTQAHDAYRWLCGGVQVNYHTLADFRSHQGDALDDLLTDHVASLMARVPSSSRRRRRTGCAYERVREPPRSGEKRSSKRASKRRGRR